MKTIGKVVEYDGYSGNIIDEEGNEYLLLKKEILNEEDNINVNDIVSFAKETIYNLETPNKNVARFIKKVKRR